ncbi:hypothetical protein MHAE_19571, partial [Mycobacterium haemophilum DSM 44634]
MPRSSATATRAARWLLLALVSTWALRLSWHIYRKTAGKGEDARYASLLRGATAGQVVRKVFLLQGFLTLFVSFPLQLSAVSGPTSKPLLAVTGLGLAVWLDAPIRVMGQAAVSHW